MKRLIRRMPADTTALHWRAIPNLLRILVCTGSALGATAQDLTIKAPHQRRAIRIENATIHPHETSSDGVRRTSIERGYIWFDAGTIRGIGAMDEAGERAAFEPADIEIIDARGWHVYPGLIGANTTIGLEEIGSVRATRDVAETGLLTPEVRAAVAVNPDSTVIPVTRRNGVLTVGVVPTGGLVAGRASVMQLEGWTYEEMTVAAECAVVVNWPALPRAGDDAEAHGRQLEAALQQRADIAALFDAARAHHAARATDPSPRHDLRADALGPALRREVPVWLRADGFEQIQSAVLWAVDAELRPIVVGGREAAACVDLLREHDVGVIVTGVHRLPSRRDAPHDQAFRLPLELHEAGLRFCIASDEPFYNERNLPYHAATAVAHGLPHDIALRAITSYAAELLGVGDRLGSLRVGSFATLIVTDGDPLEITTEVKMAFVSGRRIALTSKHETLADKYREKYRQLEPR